MKLVNIVGGMITNHEIEIKEMNAKKINPNNNAKMKTNIFISYRRKIVEK